MEQPAVPPSMGSDDPALARSDQPDGPVVDTTIEHTRWGIVVTQHVHKRKPQLGDKILAHQRRLHPRGGRAIQQHELDLIDHQTGRMLQQLGGANPHSFGITDVHLSAADLQRILEDPL